MSNNADLLHSMKSKQNLVYLSGSGGSLSHLRHKNEEYTSCLTINTFIENTKVNQTPTLLTELQSQRILNSK